MDEFLLLSLRNLGKKTYHLDIPRKDLSWHHCLHNNFKYILTLINSNAGEMMFGGNFCQAAASSIPLTTPTYCLFSL